MLTTSYQEFITRRVCNCHRVSTTTISAVWYDWLQSLHSLCTYMDIFTTDHKL